MDTINYVSVPVIGAAVYAIITMIKQAANNSEKLLRFLPLMSIVLGAALGITAYYIGHGLIPAADAFDALLLGGASGLAATGTHQMFKQISKDPADSAAKNGEPPAEEPSKTEPPAEESPKSDPPEETKK